MAGAVDSGGTDGDEQPFVQTVYGVASAIKSSPYPLLDYSIQSLDLAILL
eukprot:jgi/Botrbrau1/15659/Bobra.4_1s0043.1